MISGNNPRFRNKGTVTMPTGVGLIADERQRQLAHSPWSIGHDASVHADGSLAKVAGCLIQKRPDSFGLHKRYKKDRIRQLQVAGALIAAEIDRLIYRGAKVNPE